MLENKCGYHGQNFHFVLVDVIRYLCQIYHNQQRDERHSNYDFITQNKYIHNQYSQDFKELINSSQLNQNNDIQNEINVNIQNQQQLNNNNVNINQPYINTLNTNNENNDTLYSISDPISPLSQPIQQSINDQQLQNNYQKEETKYDNDIEIDKKEERYNSSKKNKKINLQQFDFVFLDLSILELIEKDIEKLLEDPNCQLFEKFLKINQIAPNFFMKDINLFLELVSFLNLEDLKKLLFKTVTEQKEQKYDFQDGKQNILITHFTQIFIEALKNHHKFILVQIFNIIENVAFTDYQIVKYFKSLLEELERIQHQEQIQEDKLIVFWDLFINLIQEVQLKSHEQYLESNKLTPQQQKLYQNKLKSQKKLGAMLINLIINVPNKFSQYMIPILKQIQNNYLEWYIKINLHNQLIQKNQLNNMAQNFKSWKDAGISFNNENQNKIFSNEMSKLFEDFAKKEKFVNVFVSL
ncbi:hypothetical protein PPERSA_06518 [Pseudocohnilembus persalinus]|uniref:Uncharacterized protein n=1 Tax=Pseudocohnilembus persalinus TaxID=266149 RepID=A0A0V0QRN5_PSEPJ|nr:hypothetical protein PPERSA_06518 [Pseudocohnilembus persalinus]|eukprot:KRX04884.1 hypothetical protein PPERSA_06518 [Pseudocohnilembus persalinus]